MSEARINNDYLAKKQSFCSFDILCSDIHTTKYSLNIPSTINLEVFVKIIKIASDG